MRRSVGAVLFLLAATPVLASEGAGESAGFLGVPTVVWQSINFIVYFGLLAYFLAKPLGNFFRGRREGVARELSEAERQQLDAVRLREEMEERVATLQREVAALRERMVREGEREREALERHGTAEAERLGAQLDDEVARRVAAARGELAREAAGVASRLAWDLLQREMTDADRERIFNDTLARLESGGGR